MKTIIFDFDGTLVDTFSESVSVYNEKIAPYFGISKVEEREIESLRKKPILEVLDHLGIKPYKLPLIAAKIRVLMTESTGTAKLVDGMGGVLDRIKRTGYRIGIVSSNSRKNIALCMKHNDVDCVDFIHTGRNLFGKHLVIRKCMKAYGIRRDDVVYVGDEIRDIEACRKAGVKIVSVCWGYNSREGLGKLNAGFLAEKVEDILGYL